MSTWLPQLWKMFTTLPLEAHVVGQAQRVTLPAIDGVEAFDPPSSSSFLFWGLLIIDGHKNPQCPMLTILDNIGEKTFCVKMDGINTPTILNPGCFPDRVDSNGELLDWFHFQNAKHGHYVQGMVDLIQSDLGNVNVYLVMGLFPMRLLKTSRVARE
jgi:hypothetical protein